MVFISITCYMYIDGFLYRGLAPWVFDVRTMRLVHAHVPSLMLMMIR